MKRGRQFEHYLAKVALVSGLADKEEKLRIFEQLLCVSKKCAACKFPITNTEHENVIVCKNDECEFVLRCARPECPGTTHNCHICKTTPVCRKVFGENEWYLDSCGECEMPTCTECEAPCETCNLNFVCRKCSPGPYFPYDRPWAMPKPEQLEGEFCADHLQEYCRSRAVFETCAQCVVDLTTRGWVAGCRKCSRFPGTAVCQHTERGPGQQYCDKHNN